MKIYNLKNKLIATGINISLLCALNTAQAQVLTDLSNQFTQYQCVSVDPQNLKFIELDNDDEFIVKVTANNSELGEIKTTYFAKKESEEKSFLFSTVVYSLKNENYQNLENAHLKVVERKAFGRGGCGRGGCQSQLQTVQALLSINSNETVFSCN